MNKIRILSSYIMIPLKISTNKVKIFKIKFNLKIHPNKTMNLLKKKVTLMDNSSTINQNNNTNKKNNKNKNNNNRIL